MRSHWLLYSHDALGLGHARRMTGIARAVLPSRPDVSALLVTCSPQIDALPVPPGLDYVKLPSARKLAASQYVARTLRIEPNRCEAKMGKPEGAAADCVLKTSPEIFLKIVREAYTPSPMEFMSGAVKSNDISLLLTFQKVFDLA